MPRHRPHSFFLCCWMCAVAGAFLCWLMWHSTAISLADEPAVKTKSAPRYETRKRHDPNGIGKFYMGREIALVMGFPAADWLERVSREEEERTSIMVKSLGIEPGMTVADIGAGSGRISLMMADYVGEGGKVLAVDIQQEMLDLIALKLQERELENVQLVKGTEKSPKLESETVDLALMVDVYHEFKFPYEMMEQISAALRPGGRVAFVEFRLEDPNVPIKLVHKMSEEQVKREMSPEEFHLEWKETIGILPWQHIVVFEKKTSE